jgi:integrase
MACFTITVKHTVTGTGNYQIKEDSTKTTRSRRTIFLLPELESYLLLLKEQQKQMKKSYGSDYEISDYICTWDDGHLMSPEYVSRKFKAILQTSDLPVYRFHDLRHSSTSLLG